MNRKSIFWILFLVIIWSCNSELTKDESIQREILQDEDFVVMMANVFLANKVVALNDEAENSEYNSAFNSYFSRLNERYPNFHNNVQLALGNRTSAAYTEFAIRLEAEIEFRVQSAKGLSYDGESVCNRPCSSGTSATACITGCYYSSTWCFNNGGVNCGAMRESCIDSCCDAYCPQEPGFGG